MRRLNLRFEEESEEVFQKRLDYCQSKREEAKSLMRLDYFLERQPDSGVESIPDWTLDDISARIGPQLSEEALTSPLIAVNGSPRR